MSAPEDANGSGPRRLYQPPLAELLDQLTILQIKEVMHGEGKESYRQEMLTLQHDIDLILREQKNFATGRLLRAVIMLSQMNLHIWHLKDRMQAEPQHYLDHLKSAHQLNGIRNQIKNLILNEVGDARPATVRSNLSPDGLEGWNIDLG